MPIRSTALLARLTPLYLLPVAAILAGCAGMSTTATPDIATGLSIKGNVHGGQQPVSGAHVYLLQAATTGYGAASISKLVAGSTGTSDSVGAYVLSAANGTFTITGDYNCTPNTQLYLYALGGNPGINGTNNTAIGLMAAVGNCPSTGSFASTTPFIAINEVSTIAAAYSLAGFAVDSTHVASSATALAATDLANAFLTPANLAAISTGVALTTTPAGNGVVPQTTINTLANIISSCVNSTGPSSTACTMLFGAARASGTTGTIPTDTATAAINIAHNPAANISTLFGLSTANPPFAPALASAPNDFLLGVNYNGTGASGGGVAGGYSIAIDASGNVWITDVNGGAISKLSPQGAALSPAAGFGTAQNVPTAVSIDPTGNVWVTDSFNNTLTEYSSAGVVLQTLSGGGIESPQSVAIDGNGNVWVANFLNMSLSEFNTGGVAVSPSGGFMGGGLNSSTSIAIDKQQNPWIGNQKPVPGNISRFATNGTPVSPSTGYMGAGISNIQAIAFDSSSNVWTANFGDNSVAELSSTGTAISSTSGYTGGGLSNPKGISIDGAGNVWVANNGNSTVTELTNAGVAVSPSTGFGVGGIANPEALEVDGSGNVWLANNPSSGSAVNAVTELIGAAVPKITPISAALKLGTPATRP